MKEHRKLYELDAFKKEDWEPVEWPETEIVWEPLDDYWQPIE